LALTAKLLCWTQVASGAAGRANAGLCPVSGNEQWLCVLKAFYIYKCLFTENTAATQKHSRASINTNREKTTTKSIKFYFGAFLFGAGGCRGGVMTQIRLLVG